MGCLKRWLLGCVGGGLEGWIRNLREDRTEEESGAEKRERYDSDVTPQSIALHHGIRFIVGCSIADE